MQKGDCAVDNYILNEVKNKMDEYVDIIYKAGYNTGFEEGKKEYKEGLYTKEQVEGIYSKAFEDGSKEGYKNGYSDAKHELVDVYVEEFNEACDNAERAGYDKAVQDNNERLDEVFEEGLNAAFETIKIICNNDHTDRSLDRKLMDVFNTVSPELILERFTIKEIVARFDFRDVNKPKLVERRTKNRRSFRCR